MGVLVVYYAYLYIKYLYNLYNYNSYNTIILLHISVGGTISSSHISTSCHWYERCKYILPVIL